MISNEFSVVIIGKHVKNYKTFFNVTSFYRSVSPVMDLCHLASGDMTCGCSMMKVGLMHVSSRNSPTN